MEKKGVLLPVLLATGAAAFYLMALTQRERRLSGDYESVNVLVAKIDLPERTALREELVEAAPVPRKYAAPDAFEVRGPSDLKLVSNLVTRVRIPKGAQVGQSALTTLSPTAGLSVKVPPGYRGSLLPVDNDLAKLLKPGDRVDILITFDARMPDQSKEKVTATILQNVLVLGVGGDLGQGLAARDAKAAQEAEQRAAAFSEKGFLSLALNPLEAQYLALCLEQGKVSVVLRGLGDTAMTPIEMSALKKLFR